MRARRLSHRERGHDRAMIRGFAANQRNSVDRLGPLQLQPWVRRVENEVDPIKFVSHAIQPAARGASAQRVGPGI